MPPIDIDSLKKKYPLESIVESEVLPFKDFAEIFWNEDSGTFIPESVGSLPRWHKIFLEMTAKPDLLWGPTVDVASGSGIIYRAVKRLLPGLLPYSVTELKQSEVTIENDTIPVHKFECEKERLPLEDKSQGTVFFFDVLEHLLVDPVWTLLEFNRVLKPGGHIVISTPNVIGANRIARTLFGINPGTDNEYKPCALYQRHNREWTPMEVSVILNMIGFNPVSVCTFLEALLPEHLHLLQELNAQELLGVQPEFFGPDIICIYQKDRHVTLDQDLPDDIRWPSGLYTHYKTYRKRPAVFPIVIADDYA